MSERKDWCSNFPDEVGGVYYGDCCRRHDHEYSIPGDRHKRRLADVNLRDCVTLRAVAKWGKKWGERFGKLVWYGVRSVGWLPWHYNRTIFGRRLNDGERAELEAEFSVGGSADH